MAKPTSLSFAHFKVFVGDGASPEVFAAPCGFVDKSLALTTATTDTLIPDCDDPEAPAWTEKGVTSLSAQVQGKGILALEALTTWRAWWAAATEKNVRISYDHVGMGGYWEGPAILTHFGNSVALNANGNKVQIDVTIDNASAWTWTAV